MPHPPFDRRTRSQPRHTRFSRSSQSSGGRRSKLPAARGCRRHTRRSAVRGRSRHRPARPPAPRRLLPSWPTPSRGRIQTSFQVLGFGSAVDEYRTDDSGRALAWRAGSIGVAPPRPDLDSDRHLALTALVGGHVYCQPRIAATLQESGIRRSCSSRSSWSRSTRSATTEASSVSRTRRSRGRSCGREDPRSSSRRCGREERHEVRGASRRAPPTRARGRRSRRGR